MTDVPSAEIRLPYALRADRVPAGGRVWTREVVEKVVELMNLPREARPAAITTTDPTRGVHAPVVPGSARIDDSAEDDGMLYIVVRVEMPSMIGMKVEPEWLQ